MKEVILIAALSSDGFIAREKSEISTHWTSKEDAQWFAQITKAIGLCVMGRTTFQTIGRPLPDRSTIILTSQPTSFNQPQIQPLEQVSGKLPELVSSNLKPVELLSDLVRRNYEAVAICGGARVYTDFMLAGVVTKLYLTLEPVLFGQGVRLFTEPLDEKLTLIATHKLSEQTIVQELVVSQ